MKRHTFLMFIAIFSLFLQTCDSSNTDCKNNYKLVDGTCVLQTSYEIQFVVMDGMESMEPITIHEGESLQLPVIDSTFDAVWYTDSTYETLFDENDEITSNMTLYLALDDVFTVSFVVPEELDEIPSQEVDYLTNAVDPQIVSDRPYTWYEDERLETVFSFHSVITKDTTLYLGYDSGITISFVVPEGVDPIQTLYLEEGELIQIPEIDFTRSYKWYCDETFTTRCSIPYAASEDATYYLQLDPLVYTVYFMYEKSTIISFMEVADLQDIEFPELRGYQTDEWYIDASLTTVFDVETIRIDELNPTLTLYGDFEAVYHNITYIIDGDIVSRSTVQEGQRIPYFLPDLDVVYFLHWYLDEQLDERYLEQYMPKEDVTLYGSVVTEQITYTDYTNLYSDDTYVTYAGVEGVVTYVSDLYAVVSDGDHTVVIFREKFAPSCSPYRDCAVPLVILPPELLSVDVGDYIRIEGVVTRTEDTLHMSWTNSSVISEDNPLPFETLELSVSEYLSMESSGVNLYGRSIKITGEFMDVENSPLVYLTDGTNRVYIEFYLTDIYGNHYDFSVFNNHNGYIELLYYGTKSYYLEDEEITVDAIYGFPRFDSFLPEDE